MGSRQVRILAAAAIGIGLAPLAFTIVNRVHVHSISEGIHYRVDLPGGLVLESRLEPAASHRAATGCEAEEVGG